MKRKFRTWFVVLAALAVVAAACGDDDETPSGDTGTTTVSRLETAQARTAEIVTARGGAEYGLVPLAQ